MKYRNAAAVLPESLVEAIQTYVQGEYLYIPVREKPAVTTPTVYQTELEKRDAHIYLHSLEGLDNRRLASLYHLSESSIRRIIAKQRKCYADMKENLEKILTQWGLQDYELRQIYQTTWQVDDRYVLKVYTDPDMLRRNVALLQILADQNIPVGEIVPTLIQESFAAAEGRYYILTRKLPGSNIVDLHGDPNLACRMGGIIADLHLAFLACESRAAFRENSLLDEMRGWVRAGLAAAGWKYVSEAEYDGVVAKLAALYGELPIHLIHRDVHFGNFLFADGRFSGYIDFDLSQRNIRIFDLSYFLLGLLSEEEKYDLTEEQWLAFARDVFAGYEQKQPLSDAEKRAVPSVMACIELLFVAYFEGQQDTLCAEDAWKIYRFVRDKEDLIWNAV